MSDMKEVCVQHTDELGQQFYPEWCPECLRAELEAAKKTIEGHKNWTDEMVHLRKENAALSSSAHKLHEADRKIIGDLDAQNAAMAIRLAEMTEALSQLYSVTKGYCQHIDGPYDCEYNRAKKVLSNPSPSLAEAEALLKVLPLAQKFHDDAHDITPDSPFCESLMGVRKNCDLADALAAARNRGEKL